MTKNLINISVSKKNNCFCDFDNNKYFSYKSNENEKNFDALVCAKHGIEEITIPSKIKSISSFAFGEYESIKTVKFASDSILQSIGINAFRKTLIKSIQIPSNVTFTTVLIFELFF